MEDSEGIEKFCTRVLVLRRELKELVEHTECSKNPTGITSHNVSLSEALNWVDVSISMFLDEEAKVKRL
jgi:hypothetical protein